MKELFHYVVITVIGIVLYFIGNFLIGERNEGGKRTIIAIAGIIAGVLGYSMAKYFLENEEKFSDKLLVALGIAFVGFGIYLFLTALFASQKYIVKLFDGLLGGL